MLFFALPLFTTPIPFFSSLCYPQTSPYCNRQSFILPCLNCTSRLYSLLFATEPLQTAAKHFRTAPYLYSSPLGVANPDTTFAEQSHTNQRRCRTKRYFTLLHLNTTTRYCAFLCRYGVSISRVALFPIFKIFFSFCHT